MDSFENTAEIYKALGDKTRLHMLALLAKDELCVCELVAILELSQPSVSQHLRKLKQAGLVKERKTAQWVFYSLHESTFPLLKETVNLLPDVSEEVKQLQSQGLRVQCNL
ncbi:metalloregulator ArsR/SmtB family transcription factor [Alicyclobacillus tolerans]|uniref:ArsR/SmtB family transcription factor n=1 Tax=Alicyclobacillus tolerans TaxID=90970 RepID=UPI001F031609|nr:metalloregulator ArsR/SmtB family transcription factor [Alicyclobacillus tolerans]MCF8565902.1 metalloregulator ArsR/SmtB family transcription factor [Alicyclobacillus tolerans]